MAITWFGAGNVQDEPRVSCRSIHWRRNHRSLKACQIRSRDLMEALTTKDKTIKFQMNSDCN